MDLCVCVWLASEATSKGRESGIESVEAPGRVLETVQREGAAAEAHARVSGAKARSYAQLRESETTTLWGPARGVAVVDVTPEWETARATATLVSGGFGRPDAQTAGSQEEEEEEPSTGGQPPRLNASRPRGVAVWPAGGQLEATSVISRVYTLVGRITDECCCLVLLLLVVRRFLFADTVMWVFGFRPSFPSVRHDTLCDRIGGNLQLTAGDQCSERILS
nr:unnamed protein product [Digitaria exilis]